MKTQKNPDEVIMWEIPQKGGLSSLLPPGRRRALKDVPWALGIASSPWSPLATGPHGQYVGSYICSSWYWFCMGWLTLGTEPGCSLFMSMYRIIPSFRPSWKSGPIDRPVRPSIQLRSSTSLCLNRSEISTSAGNLYLGLLLNCVGLMVVASAVVVGQLAGAVTEKKINRSHW